MYIRVQSLSLLRIFAYVGSPQVRPGSRFEVKCLVMQISQQNWILEFRPIYEGGVGVYADLNCTILLRNSNKL